MAVPESMALQKMDEFASLIEMPAALTEPREYPPLHIYVRTFHF